MIHRKHVQHRSPKNFQLDLFTPDDGHYEYAAVATNLTQDLRALFAFICGRGAEEKTIAELEGVFALDVVPTNHCGANSAWQQLSILAHNVARNFQLDTLATPKPRSRKGTYTYLWRSMRTLRFLLIARAGRVTRIGGRNVLRLSQNPATEQLFAKVSHALVAFIFGLGLCIGPTPSALAMAAAVLRPGGQTRGRAMPNNDLGSEKLLTKGEVAQLCRVEVRTVDRWLIAGKIRCYRTPSGRVLFRRNDVLVAIEREPARRAPRSA